METNVILTTCIDRLAVALVHATETWTAVNGGQDLSLKNATLWLATFVLAGATGGLIGAIIEYIQIITYTPISKPELSALDEKVISDLQKRVSSWKFYAAHALGGVGGAFAIILGGMLLSKIKFSTLIENYLFIISLCVFAGMMFRKIIDGVWKQLSSTYLNQKVESSYNMAKASAGIVKDSAADEKMNFSKIDILEKQIDGLAKLLAKKAMPSESPVQIVTFDSGIPKDVFEASLASLEEALKLKKNAKGLGYKGYLLKRLGKFSEAIDTLNEAISIDDQENKYLTAMFYWNRACYKCLNGMHVSYVVQDIRKAVELMPDFKNDIESEGDFSSILGTPEVQELLV